LYKVAEQSPNKQFKIAYRNTDKVSLNGYTGFEMIEMFNTAGAIPSNIVFSKEWFDTNRLNKNIIKSISETNFKDQINDFVVEDLAVSVKSTNLQSSVSEFIRSLNKVEREALRSLMAAKDIIFKCK
jgi:hypothetical protein